MNQIRVRHVSGDEFLANVRGHELRLDQPIDAGGTDVGPTATELFVTGLVGCVAHYARGFLARHGIDPEGLTVTGDWAMAADRPARVSQVSVEIQPPQGFPAQKRAALLAVASHCTVHNSLTQPPRVSVQVAEADMGAVA
jgi:uncharacterized OsmC-like protein